MDEGNKLWFWRISARHTGNAWSEFLLDGTDAALNALLHEVPLLTGNVKTKDFRCAKRDPAEIAEWEKKYQAKMQCFGALRLVYSSRNTDDKPTEITNGVATMFLNEKTLKEFLKALEFYRSGHYQATALSDVLFCSDWLGVD